MQPEKSHIQPPLDQNTDLLQDQVETRERGSKKESWKDKWVSDQISSVYKTKKIHPNSPGQINIKAESNGVSCSNLLRPETKPEVGWIDVRGSPEPVGSQHQCRAAAGDWRTVVRITS